MPISDQLPLPPSVYPKPRVLIVDDEPSVRHVARLILELDGYAVVEAATADDALECVRGAERRFVVILLDVTLPDRPGTELIPELWAAAPRSNIVLTSGKPLDGATEFSADGYLPKPFTRDQLVKAIRAVTALTPT
ncbi:MAG: response regulator [Planctomycetes bacterium]|nr:response regulator [Planctomycetota bacterium]